MSDSLKDILKTLWSSLAAFLHDTEREIESFQVLGIQEEEEGGLKAILHFSHPQLGFLVISWHFKVCIAHFQFHLEAIMTLKHAIMS